MDLDSMKYPQLRSLAKELGLKTNMKADKLLKAIKRHYQQEKNNMEKEGQGQEKTATAVREDEHATQHCDEENKDASCEEDVSSSAVFVNTRRGKGNCTKRSFSDTATVCDAKLPPSAEEVDIEAVPSVERSRAKKRKMSSDKTAKECQSTGSEQQRPDVQDEAPQRGDTDKVQKVAKAGKIPRYQKLQQKNKPLLKPITPNFKKLHEAHFDKMESIDSYVQRKNKQVETYKSAAKELKKPSDKTKLQQVDDKVSRASMFSPVPANKKAAEETRRRTLLSASKAPPNKPAGKEDAPFRPSVLSARRINVRFSEATHDNEHKRSLLKTPARMSPRVTSSTPRKTTEEGMPNNFKTPAFSATITSGPFVFTGNTSTSATPGTQKKSTFDLKASLSRPLTYKPHTGKLKPFGETKENTAENTAVNKSLISNSHQKNYKQHQVQTRVDRRAKHMEDRKQKKESMLGARRGIVMM